MHLKSIRLHRDRFPNADVYPFTLDVLRNTESIDFVSPITFLLGENGCGKTTLLRALSKACGIYLWGQSDRVRYQPSPLEGSLHNYFALQWADKSVPGSYFDSEVFLNFSRILDEWAVADPGILKYFGGESLVSKSHGQRNFTFFEHRFSREGLYLLDEPETALSPVKQIEFIELISRCAKNHRAQFIIASHSPILLATPQADLKHIGDSIITSVPYEETDYFIIYKQFLERQAHNGGDKS